MAIATLPGSIDETVSAPAAMANSGVAHTKGDYLELEDSTTFASDGIIVVSTIGSDSTAEALIDLATGAAASESDKLANFPVARNGDATPWAGLFPLQIPTSTRVASRFQSTSTTAAVRTAVYLIAKDTVAFHECTSCVTYGANTTDTGGVSIDPGATINTKGAYIEITSSTSADIKWLAIGLANQANQTRTAANFLVDIATGAESSESIIISNLYFGALSVPDVVGPFYFPPIPIEIASGTRIAVRAQCDINDATDRLFDIILFGFNGTASGGSGGGGFSAWMG